MIGSTAAALTSSNIPGSQRAASSHQKVEAALEISTLFCRSISVCDLIILSAFSPVFWKITSLTGSPPQWLILPRLSNVLAARAELQKQRLAQLESLQATMDEINAKQDAIDGTRNLSTEADGVTGEILKVGSQLEF